MYILTSQEMREADLYTIEKLCIPSLTLMERAGIALAEEVEKLASSGKIVCVCGGGNNGGDGFVCARILKEKGREVEVCFYADKTSKDCRANMEKWLLTGGTIKPKLPKNVALVVDCLYGTGFHGALKGRDEEIANAINAMKKQGTKVLSADIPSGLNGENGNAEGVVIKADTTLCIGEIKTGVLFGDGMDYSGEIKRVDIGIVLPKKDYATWMNEKVAAKILPKRKRNSHKGTYGRAAIVAGSVLYTGAAYLASLACLHAGAGYTTLFTPSKILPHYILKAPEILLKTTNEGGMYAFNEERMLALLEYDSIAYGMGMGVSEEVLKGAIYLLEHYEGKLILDADGLNALATCKEEKLAQIFQNKKCDVILTPHKKEFSRLSKLAMEEVGLCTAKNLAKGWGVNVLLKNAASIVTDGAQVGICTSGCSGQAKGGSGDVLAGVMASLCAMGASTYDSGLLGTYLCGKAAELASKEIGEYSLTASDVISYLGRAFLFVTENANEDGGE